MSWRACGRSRFARSRRAGADPVPVAATSVAIGARGAGPPSPVPSSVPASASGANARRRARMAARRHGSRRTHLLVTAPWPPVCESRANRGSFRLRGSRRSRTRRAFSTHRRSHSMTHRTPDTSMLSGCFRPAESGSRSVDPRITTLLRGVSGDRERRRRNGDVRSTVCSDLRPRVRHSAYAVSPMCAFRPTPKCCPAADARRPTGGHDGGIPRHGRTRTWNCVA